ncbi:probable zinc metalloprotease EGY2, chloroplastic isoform X3 [Capsicum annuum]|uniref:probable zinc metalloprotease EGY2, chloroplastic isoform X3 n=1 Tax=Capsicum annuum TaxID=4072 RepID=UPI001FB0D5FD|nr:probable zinc metalloprotease EGY2, chloroplastic isoform X3 [Capsicum annuum]
MDLPAVCRVPPCCYNRRQPLFSSPSITPQKHMTAHFIRFVLRNKGSVVCRLSETETEPDKNDDKSDKEADGLNLNDPVADKSLELNSQAHQFLGIKSLKCQDKDQPLGMLENTSLENNNGAQVNEQSGVEGGVLFKGNLRGQAAKTYEKVSKRMQEKLGDDYKLFLLINPEDDKPVVVVVPRMTLQPEATAVPEWFAAGAFGLITVFTLLLRNVPALQSNLLSVFDNLDLLKNGLPGALITAFLLVVHEVSHRFVATEVGIKLGIPYFVPSWQIGSFGAITRILNVVPKREDLLKVAAAGPLAGFSVGLILLLSGFILPPTDGIGIIIDPSVFHESFLAGGIAKLLLGDVLKEGTPISVNPLVIWAWAGLLINSFNSIPAGELDGGRVAFAMWGRKASARLSALSIGLLGISSLLNDVAFYWVVLIFFLQRGPIAPLSEEISDPDNKYMALGVVVLLLGLLVCLPYPFPFSNEAATTGF